MTSSVFNKIMNRSLQQVNLDQTLLGFSTIEMALPLTLLSESECAVAFAH